MSIIESARIAVSSSLLNQDALLIAIRRLNGRLRMVNVEDLALEADSILPQRFSWSRYRNQIDLEKVRASVRCLSRKGGEEFVVGGTKDGWMLTPVGVAYTERFRNRVDNVVPKGEMDAISSERERLSGHRLIDYMARGETPPRDVICDFFHPADIPPSASNYVLLTRIDNIPDLPPHVSKAAMNFSKLL